MPLLFKILDALAAHLENRDGHADVAMSVACQHGGDMVTTLWGMVAKWW